MSATAVGWWIFSTFWKHNVRCLPLRMSLPAANARRGRIWCVFTRPWAGAGEQNGNSPNLNRNPNKLPSNMKHRAELNQELRQHILGLPGVTERPDAGIHEDAFFVGRSMFMHIHGYGHCDIRLAKAEQERVLRAGKALPHRWAPGAGYVTYIVRGEKDFEPVLELIRLSHQH